MSIELGTTDIAAVKLGTTAIAKVYHGTTQVFPAAAPGGVVTVLGIPVAGMAASGATHTQNIVIPAGSNRCLFATVAIDLAAVPTSPTVTSSIDGALTLIASTGNAGISLFYKVNPTVGTHTLTHTTTNPGSGSGNAGMAICFAGVNQTTPYSSLQTTPGSGTSLSQTVTTATGDMVVDFATLNGGGLTVTVGANQTVQGGTPYDAGLGGGQTILMSTQAGADGGAMTWTWVTSSSRFGAFALNVKAA